MVPVRAWRPRLAVATVIHRRAPRRRGLGPALRSAGPLVDRPIADRATATRNTDASSSGLCAPAGMTPVELTMATRTKPMRNQGTSLKTRRGDIRASPLLVALGAVAGCAEPAVLPPATAPAGAPPGATAPAGPDVLAGRRLRSVIA